MLITIAIIMAEALPQFGKKGCFDSARCLRSGSSSLGDPLESAV